MVLTKEYRICMPVTVEEYQIGQLYMIARHSLEQSGDGEGVEVIENKECFDEKHGKGQFTEKRIHLSSRLPYWVQAVIPKIFYVTEKAWNYYPFTTTEYTCSFIPRFNIAIETKYENNNGCTENCLDLTPEQLAERIVDHIDIAYDEVSAKHYKEEEDPRYFQSKKTHRGPLVDGWRTNSQPIMCSYKLVHGSFKCLDYRPRWRSLFIRPPTGIRVDRRVDRNVYGRRQSVRKSLQQQTNSLLQQNTTTASDATNSQISDAGDTGSIPSIDSTPPDTPRTPKSPSKKGYFSNWF